MLRKALGRGLEALIPTSSAVDVLDPGAHAGKVTHPGVREIPVASIGANPHQPRTRFDDEGLRELADSIRATGVLQPVLLRPDNEGYLLVAGERRLRAAQLAGLETIPAIIREFSDAEMMEIALIENVQREDLNPIDEANAYQALIEKIGLTHDQISERVGKQRSSITNALRLLGLPPEVREMVSRGTLTAGHARALLAIEGPGDVLAAARYVHSKGFSVRRTEAFVRRRLRRAHSRPRTPKMDGAGEWAVKLQQRFATHVAITTGPRGGKVEFEYYGQDDLERLLEAWGVL